MLKKHLKCLVFILLIFTFISPINAASLEDSEISASSAALMVADTKELIYGKNEHDRHSMASTTKIMTSVLAFESGELNKNIKITKPMTTVEGTSIGLTEGDEVSLYTLICGMLLESGNDAANAVAYALSGSQEEFSKKMNQKASQIGMSKTHFVTPSGLDDKNHYSTAYDMALLGSYAVLKPQFRAVSSKTSITMSYGNPACTRTFSNHNKLLKIYPDAIGVKTGFTKKSGRCLVSAAERNGIIIVAVTLNAPNDWSDHQKLLDYGFSQIEQYTLKTDYTNLKIPVVSGNERYIELYPQKSNISVYADNKEFKEIVYLPRFVYAPIKTGEKIGELRIIDSSGKLFKTVPLLSKNTVEVKNYVSKETKQKKTFGEQAKIYLKRKLQRDKR